MVSRWVRFSFQEASAEHEDGCAGGGKQGSTVWGLLAYCEAALPLVPAWSFVGSDTLKVLRLVPAFQILVLAHLLLLSVAA